MPIVIVASFILAPVICWVIAPMLRAQWSRQQNALRLEEAIQAST
jgi:hypothetical protein